MLQVVLGPQSVHCWLSQLAQWVTNVDNKRRIKTLCLVLPSASTAVKVMQHQVAPELPANLSALASLYLKVIILIFLYDNTGKCKDDQAIKLLMWILCSGLYWLDC